MFTSEYPYHVTARCNNRDWFDLPMHEVWNIFGDYLYLIRLLYEVEIHSFVLMSNHFHLIMTTPNANIGEVMNYFMREVSKEIARSTNRINHIFGGQYRATVILKNHYYLHAYKYVYRNPIEAGLSKTAECYLFSTLNGLLGFSRLVIPVKYDALLFSDIEKTLDWINKEYSTDHKDVIRNALRYPKYKIRKDREKRKPHDLEREIS